jgi:hypothetical protein
LFLFFQDTQFQPLLGVLLRLFAYCAQESLHPLLDGEVDLTFCIVKFTLLPYQPGLGFLRLGKFLLALLEDRLKFRKFFVFLIEVGLGNGDGSPPCSRSGISGWRDRALYHDGQLSGLLSFEDPAPIAVM